MSRATAARRAPDPMDLPLFPSATGRITAVLFLIVIAILATVLWLANDRLIGGLGVLAASGSGALIGLLFAIPKRSATGMGTAADALAPRTTSALVANTSLEEVSDWLTKTIVGVGLVSWASVLSSLNYAGAELGMAVTGDATHARACGVALILASSAHAGMGAYLWFSRYLPAEFIDAYRDKGDTQGLTQQKRPVAPSAPTAPSSSVGPASGAEEAGDQGNAATESFAPPVTSLSDAVAAKYARMRTAPIDVEDWVSGLFGGHSRIENRFGTRELCASVKEVTKGVYQVVLTVSADPPPEGPCVFFLHNTFTNTTPSVGFDDKGQATLTLTAWGAFSVGVLTDDGSTELELNLATLPGVPRGFLMH